MFHINDLIIVHVQPATVTEDIKLLDNNYESKNPLTVTREKIHEYLRMTIDFSLKRAYAMSQCDFIKKMQKLLSEDLKGLCCKYLVADFLFKVDESAESVIA